MKKSKIFTPTIHFHHKLMISKFFFVRSCIIIPSPIPKQKIIKTNVTVYRKKGFFFSGIHNYRSRINVSVIMTQNMF